LYVEVWSFAVGIEKTEHRKSRPKGICQRETGDHYSKERTSVTIDDS